MSARDAAATTVRRETSSSPLLAVFLFPMLLIVGLVLWIGASPTWVLVGVAMATIGAMTGLVMHTINRLLRDADGAGNPDVLHH